MARIAGVVVPDRKHIVIALRSIYGIGPSRAKEICKKLDLPSAAPLRTLSELDLDRVRAAVSEYTVEGELKRGVMLNIKRLMDLGCYRGIRHRRSLPLRGQRTRTNARTRKGPPKLISKGATRSK